MTDYRPIYEIDKGRTDPDPDEIPVKDRRVFTQPYDLVVESLLDQIKGGTIFLRPLSERPSFQRRYVWTNALASKLVDCQFFVILPLPSHTFRTPTLSERKNVPRAD